ncbi:MAG TPA: hypothetical protein VL463_28690 [Kofleriaceae bacterium]|jgi:hypothetical protein|nr:hypothetical protein [Kofleriaceae bacterium]
MTRFAILAALALSACWEPVFPKGLQCSSAGTCPPGQSCDVSHFVCVEGGLPAAADARPDAPAPDGAMIGCTLVPQAGCESGKCTIDPSQPMGDPICGPASDNGIGEACAGGAPDDTCTAGGACIWQVCLPVCTTSPDTCGADICVRFQRIAGVCTPRCNVLTSPACANLGTHAATCYLGDVGTGQCEVPIGAVAVGGACNALNECVAGAGCVFNTCRRYCDHDAFPDLQAPQCAATERCLLIHDGIGACR